MQLPIKAFLSYAHGDSESAIELRDALGAAGIEAWTDDLIPAGTDLGSHLRKVMGAADVVIVLMTHTALASAYVMSELGAAIAAGKTIVPVVTNSKGIPAGMPVQLRGWNFVRAGKRNAADVAMEIRDRLQQHLPATAA